LQSKPNGTILRDSLAKHEAGLSDKNKLFSPDATIVELCLEMFAWAKYGRTKGAISFTHCSARA
jgi:hypothetical protein